MLVPSTKFTDYVLRSVAPILLMNRLNTNVKSSWAVLPARFGEQLI